MSDLNLEDQRAAAQQGIRDLRSTIGNLDQASIDLIFTRARTHHKWQDKPVTQDQIQSMYDIVKMGPTSQNSCPARFTFITSDEGRARLAKSLKPANVAKVKGAPLTVIVAYDTQFWKELTKLFPHEDRRPMFANNEALAIDTAYRNSTLQGAYLMIAARAIGLDVGGMSGFSNQTLDLEFFPDTTLKSNFICNIGYADENALFQRLPRFEFDDVCSVI